MDNIYKFSVSQRGAEPSSVRTCSNSNAIIIENASFECRAGFDVDEEPSLSFKNLALRQKGKNNEPDIVLVGRDIESLETFRSQLKSPFDKNVVTQFDTQEVILDHVFNNLSIQSSDCVDHPIVMSEPIANPNYSRKFMSELVFECYCVPSLIYYSDALSSWYGAKDLTGDHTNGVLVSIGYQTMHTVPVIEGVVDHQNIRRVSIGGYHLDYFMQKLLQLKYPIHSGAISLSRAEEIVQNHTSVANDYKNVCQKWTDMLYYDNTVSGSM